MATISDDGATLPAAVASSEGSGSGRSDDPTVPKGCASSGRRARAAPCTTSITSADAEVTNDADSAILSELIRGSGCRGTIFLLYLAVWLVLLSRDFCSLVAKPENRFPFSFFLFL